MACHKSHIGVPNITSVPNSVHDMACCVISITALTDLISCYRNVYYPKQTLSPEGPFCRDCMFLDVINALTRLLLLLLFLWLFPSSGIAAMVVDHLFPVSPVSFIALSQSYSLHGPLAHILPPCLWSPSLPFPGIAFVITLFTT